MDKLFKLFAIFIIGFSLTGMSMLAQAYYYPEHNCRVIHSHWAAGRWYPTQKVCYRTGYYRHYNHCKVIRSHWRYGQYYPAQRVCW